MTVTLWQCIQALGLVPQNWLIVILHITTGHGWTTHEISQLGARVKRCKKTLTYHCLCSLLQVIDYLWRMYRVYGGELKVLNNYSVNCVLPLFSVICHRDFCCQGVDATLNCVCTSLHVSVGHGVNIFV